MEKRKIPRFRDSIFSRTLLMLSILSLVTLAAMFFFVNSLVARNQKARLHTLHTNQLKRVAVYVDSQFSAIEQNNGQLLHATDCISLMVNPALKNSDIGYRVISAMRNSAEQNELVKRVFLYLPTTGEVYSSVGNYLPKETSASSKVIDEYLAGRRENHPDGTESETMVLHSSYSLFVVTDFCVPNFIGTMFQEIDLDVLDEQLLRNEEDVTSGFFLLDGDGNLILADDKDREAVKQAAAEGTMVDISRGDVRETGEIYTYASERYGIFFGLKTDPLAERMPFSAIALTILPFLGVYAVFAFAYSFNITRRIYQPINRLMQITAGERQDMDRMAMERGKSELDYLEQEFQNTLGENRQHKELLAEISQDVLIQMFRGILNGTVGDADGIRDRMDGLGLSAYKTGRYLALAGTIRPRDSRELSTVEEGLYQRSLLAVLSEYPKEDRLMVPFFVDNGLLAVLLCFRAEASVIQIKTQAGVLTDHIREAVEQLPYTVLFGSGKIYSEITSLRFSWQEAVDEVQYLNYLKDTPQQEWEERPARTEDADRAYFRGQAAHLAELAEKERMEDVEHVLRQLASELTGCEKERQPAILEAMMDVLLEKLLENHVTPEEIDEMNFGQTMNAAAQAADPETAGELLYGMLSSAAKAIHTNSRKNRYKYVDAAKEYISEHFSDGNLSLNEVSEAVGISAPYLSAIFAEINKGGFSSYLSAYRVSAAKRYLENSSQNVAEIGYQCGFNSAQSFSRVFKKLTGMAPGQYRERYAAQRTGTEDRA